MAAVSSNRSSLAALGRCPSCAASQKDGCSKALSPKPRHCSLTARRPCTTCPHAVTLTGRLSMSPVPIPHPPWPHIPASVLLLPIPLTSKHHSPSARCCLEHGPSWSSVPLQPSSQFAAEAAAAATAARRKHVRRCCCHSSPSPNSQMADKQLV